MSKYIIPSLLLTGCLGPLDESSYETETDVERQTVSMRIDFGQEGGSLDWQPVNDTVMGGESIGVVDYLDTVVASLKVQYRQTTMVGLCLFAVLLQITICLHSQK